MISPPGFKSDDQRWQAVSRNDKKADGIFYYAVKTTGIFCRPSCSSRLPNRANVEYILTCEEAEKKGYRPCQKCSPKEFSKTSETEEKIIRACRSIERSDKPKTLNELAAEIGLSPHHFQRTFKNILGITPKQYTTALRSKRFRKELEAGSSVTEAIYAAGFGSNSGAYNKTHSQLAMEPKVYKNGASGVIITYGLAQCHLGWVLVGATDKGVCNIEFGDEPATLIEQFQDRFPKAVFQHAGHGFTALLHEVLAFIETPKTEYSIPLDIQGTAFQQQVWNVLCRIKPGETISYSEVAERIGNPKAVRAVASACAANKVAVFIPCHRVISKNGTPGGYRWGTTRKKKLLESENK